MKSLILTAVFAFFAAFSFAQCDKNITTNFHGLSEIRGGSATPIKAEGTITFDKENIIIKSSVNGREMSIESTIQSITECKWDTLLGTGKTEYKVLSSKGPDEPKDDASITLEGVNGKLKVTFRPPGAELHFLITDYKIVK